MRKEPLRSTRILSLSDIHFGNNLVPSIVMSDKLIRVVFPYLKDIDLLILSGDITDTELSFDSLESQQVVEFFIKLYRECEKHNVTICLLRGTVSHDRNNLRTLKALHETYGFKNDLHYHETIGVTEIKHLGLRIGFLPDNLPYKTSGDAIAHLKELMFQKGWDYLDYVSFHGYAKHVVPDGMMQSDMIFDIEQFDFVKRAIASGHVHTPSHISHTFENSHTVHFFYNGSFERMAHNEEEDKGLVLIKEDGDDTEFTYIKNPYATGFHTFDLYEYKTSEEVFKVFDEKISKIDTTVPVHIRVLHPSSEIRSSLSRYVNKTYTKVVFVSKSKKSKSKESDKDASKPHHDFKSLTAPSQSNLPEMVHDFLKENQTPLDIKEIKSILESAQR